MNGRIVLRDGLISVKEIEECILKGNCKKLGIKLPAWSLLQCLLTSAKSNSDGLVICTSLDHTHASMVLNCVCGHNCGYIYGRIANKYGLMRSQLRSS